MAEKGAAALRIPGSENRCAFLAPRNKIKETEMVRIARRGVQVSLGTAQTPLVCKSETPYNFA